MISKNSLARISGFTYLLLILTGIFGIAYVPSSLIVWSDPAATTANIMTHAMLFRLGILSDILCFILFLILPFLFFQLFKSVNEKMAISMVIFSVVSVPMSLANEAIKINVLSLLGSFDLLKAIPTDQVNAQVMTLLTSYNNLTLIANIFWGLWLFPLGYLAFKSQFIPKIIGVFLMLGCFGYLTEFTLRFLLSATDVPWFISMPSTLGEFAICLWLLVMGARDKQKTTS